MMQSGSPLRSSRMNSTVAEDEVLSVLIEQQNEAINVSEVAKRSRVHGATTNRIVSRQVATGLVRDQHEGRERLVRIDTASPLYPSTAERLWVSMGVVAPPAPYDSQVPAEARRRHEHLAYRDLRGRSLPHGVPEELRTALTGGPLHARREDVDEGPLAPVVRAVVRDLENLARRSHHPIAVLQETYDRWHNERDRDLFHLLMSGSDGLSLAAAVLGRDTARFPRQAADRAADVVVRSRVGALAWTLATYAVAAEAAHLGNLAQYLEGAIGAARELRLARDREQEVREDRDAAGGAAGHVDDDKVADAASKVSTAEGQLQRYWNYRGAGEHVGAAGERALVIELEVIAGHARRLAEGMAKAVCVARWQHTHPQAPGTRPGHDQPGGAIWALERGADQERIERLIDNDTRRYGQALGHVRWASDGSDGSPWTSMGL